MSGREQLQNTFDIWCLPESLPNSWQSAVSMIVSHLWEGSPAEVETARQITEAQDKLADVDFSAVSALEDAYGADTRAAIHFAAVMGWALHATWPARLEDVEAWPARALAYVEASRQS
jgi:hypothetical protein